MNVLYLYLYVSGHTHLRILYSHMHTRKAEREGVERDGVGVIDTQPTIHSSNGKVIRFRAEPEAGTRYVAMRFFLLVNISGVRCLGASYDLIIIWCSFCEAYYSSSIIMAGGRTDALVRLARSFIFKIYLPEQKLSNSLQN